MKTKEKIKRKLAKLAKMHAKAYTEYALKYPTTNEEFEIIKRWAFLAGATETLKWVLGDEK